jgi:STE24 endopeptidase
MVADPIQVAPPDAKRYERRKRGAAIISLLVSLTFLVLMALGFGPWVGRIVRDGVGVNTWVRLAVLALLYAAGLELLTLPMAVWSGFILEHRYHLSNQTLGAWIWKEIKSYLVAGPIGLVMLFGVYALLWYAGSWWWLVAAAGWLIVTLLLGRLVPVLILPLFYRTTRLDDPAMLERLRRLAGGTGLTVEGVYRLELSAETKKANAALAGLGRSRRVLLGDTLLDQFTPKEIEVVFAHEVGHHVYRHLMKMVAVSVALTAAGFWLADSILRHAAVAIGYARFDDPGALPLLILVLTAFGLVLSPALNALSRYFERQCDRYALKRTGDRDAYRSAFRKLATMNKVDMDPNPVIVWLFDDHPPMRERLAVADELMAPT